MLKQTVFFLFFALCTRVNSEVNLDKKHSYIDKPEKLNNHPPLLTVQTGNPIHLTKQEQNNNFYIIPILKKPNLSIQTVDIHQYDPDTNILKTIIIIPPKTKKPCDRNSSVSQPPVQTEKPKTTPSSDNIKTTEEPTVTIKTTTKKPCELTTRDTSSNEITTTSSTLTVVTQTPATKLTPNPNEVTSKPNEVTLYPTEVTINPNEITTNPSEVTANPNEVATTATIERTTKAPIIGNPDGSTKCLQDGVYRANNVTCDQFYVCIHGIQYLMDCPYGLVFNEKLKICDWLENVSDCKPPAFKDITCPDDGYGIDGNLILKILEFRYRDSCSQFIACHKRKARLLSCKPGYYFHEEPSKCLNFRSNSNCRDVWYSY